MSYDLYYKRYCLGDVSPPDAAPGTTLLSLPDLIQAITVPTSGAGPYSPDVSSGTHLASSPYIPDTVFYQAPLSPPYIPAPNYTPPPIYTPPPPRKTPSQLSSCQRDPNSWSCSWDKFVNTKYAGISGEYWVMIGGAMFSILLLRRRH